MNFEHRWRIVCLLHRLAGSIWPCKLDQINVNPERNWYRLARNKIDRQIVHWSVCSNRLNKREKTIAKIGRGFRQRCCLSPMLFTSYGEYFTNEALEWSGVFKIEGQVIRAVTIAHNLVLLAKEEAVLQGMIGHILHRNCLLKHVIWWERGRRTKTTWRRGRRYKQPLDDLKETRRYW